MNKISTVGNGSNAEKGNFLQPFKFILTLFLAALTIYIVTLANYSIISSNAYYSGTITVTGHGEVEIKPDIRKLSISIQQSTSTSTSKVAATNADYVLKVVNYLKSKGVVDSDIKIVNVKSISVKLRGANLDNASSISAALEKIAPKNISVAISDPQVENQEILKARALDMALNNAKMNALKVSRSLGADLGKVTSYYDYNQNGYSNNEDAQYTEPDKVVSDVTVLYQIR
jgi:uncharacterized protein YggE